ncbi:hypothetical protein FB565_006716 [Actinoplanes lutulentus]|uniref:MFS transporter n=1 Tax=Actinoplanes lutulentus TaxID=1287878 RepID=A0A327Z495_9ACTN|nr:hypothetical protein [Actinoplanes lutulentus]MBB2946948.1 hypothetical protein [Actinoplanes lutulentus]RAK30450.1 hypothetical protein B0I29_116109 [Actinoplanes lutulentus]
MILIGAGQGLAFAPMTSAGLAGVATADAGAASGLINTFHQLGSALGLGILTSVAATAVPPGAAAQTALVDRFGAALTGGSVLLAVALLLAAGLIAAHPRRERPGQPGQPDRVRRSNRTVSRG